MTIFTILREICCAHDNRMPFLSLYILLDALSI